MIHLMNVVRKLTLATPWLTCYSSSNSLRTNLQILKSTTPHIHTHIEELLQLTDKLQHLTMVLQPALPHQSSEELVHKTMQACTDTLHATQWESNLTTTTLQDISTFDGQDYLKLGGLVHGYRDCH